MKNNKKTPLVAIATIMLCVVVVFLIGIAAMLLQGVHLEPGNWIALAGAFVGFIGSMSLALVNTWQSSKIREDSRAEMQQRQYQDVQPALQVRTGSAGGNNFSLTITNYGKHPIFNVVVFDSFCLDVLKPDDCQPISFTLENTSDTIEPPSSNSSQTHPTHRFKVSKEEYGQDEEDFCPKRVRVRYCDILGYENIQDFHYIADLGKRYYQGTNIVRGNRIHDLLQERIEEVEENIF